MFQGFRDLLTRVERRIDDIKTQPITVDASRLLKPEEVGSLFTSTAPDPAQYLNSVDTQAGAGMLVRLEASMRKLHENNDALILMAEGVDSKIYPAAMTVVNETKTVEEFKKRLSTLPTIITSIAHARKQIDNLTARFAELEAALDAHAVAHNEEQTSKQKEVFTLMLNTHNQEKQQQLAALKNEIEIQKFNLEKKRVEDRKEEHRRQLAAIESEYEQARLRLRQSGQETKNPAELARLREPYDKAIQDALEKHRLQEQEVHARLQNAPLFPSGQRPKKAAVPAAATPAAPKSGLESVKLDAGRAELEDFLSDVKEDEVEKNATPEKLAEPGAEPDSF